MFKRMDIKCMDRATITRVILAIIGIINMIAVGFGFEAIELSDEKIYVIASAIYLVVSCAWAIYKNNPTSEFGILCQRVKEICKKYEVGEVLEKLLETFPCDEEEEDEDDEEEENEETEGVE